MFDKKILNIYTIIIGIFFLISGAGKVINTAAFSNLIADYGLGYLMILAPVIVLAEILLGLSLVLLINPKRDAFISLLLLAIFTGAFAYAHFVRGINNCGCFGTVEQSSLPPVFSFIRNFILIGMSLIVWLKYAKEAKTEVADWKKNLILFVMAVAIFIAGFTYSTPNFLMAKPESNKFQNKHITNTPLSKYIQTSTGRRYLVFCFSYTCPYCWNSIENLRQFKNTNTVDSLVVFAAGEPKDKLIFENNFKPDFVIKDLTGKEMDELTKSYPTAFYVEHDTVKVVIESELPSPFIFKKMNY